MQQDMQALLEVVSEQVREINQKLNGYMLSPTVFTYEEARKRLMGISESTLRRMIRGGLILRSKVGGTYGISIQEIERVSATLVGPNGEPVEEKPQRGQQKTPRLRGRSSAKTDADKIRAALRKRH